MENWPNAPFKQTAEPIHLKEDLQRHGDVVLRFRREFATHNHEADSLDGEPVEPGMLPESPSSSHVEGLSTLRKLYTELTDEYGIEHAGFLPVVGRADDKIGEFVVSRWIEGEPAVDPTREDIPAAHMPAARQLFDKLTHYVRSKHHSGEEMLSDIYGYDQYKFVPESGSLILVDVDPYAEQEFGAEHAYKRMRTWAGQVLRGDELKAWEAEMSGMAHDSLTIKFDENF